MPTTAAQIHLHVVHRNRLFRECLASILTKAERFRVVEIDHSDPEYRNRIVLDPPDVILLDLHLPDQLALETTQHVVQSGIPAKVLLLARPDAHDQVLEGVAAGAHGCVLADCSLEELEAAIHKICHGETICSPSIVQAMFRTLARNGYPLSWQERIDSAQLTPRELEIVHLIAEGLANKQIAKRLHLSLYTVKNHVHNIIEKLQVKSRFEAVDYARRERWVIRAV